MKEIVREHGPEALRPEMRELSAKLMLEGLGHIVTVSAGAITLLVTFRSSLTAGATSMLWCLKTSWVCLAIAVLAAVMCKMTASEALSRLAGPVHRQHKASGFVETSEWLAVVSGAAFALGIVGLVVFGIANL